MNELLVKQENEALYRRKLGKKGNQNSKIVSEDLTLVKGSQ